ncbi:serine-threonine protein kinase, putative [Entamoeba invadens IP1]|uniref:Serine-threonine protein kinase, putative n=1 Tax=Entamoeba invadens IP1 TaxID=370355 RepID=L7FMS1_ENTIV|nr:serine-threonine protein kinase, putative [Entamoeba invadens IP1]ELP92233.1 serine-threonine protein kinase, putative [Entamoeba invadens IP1]|eukprot:XP_004259004.1 serine-threonine protein kinase, putative [Entamoeba invadens IP1]
MFLFLFVAAALSAECTETQYYDQTENQCKNCVANCTTCFSATKCKTCTSGHYINPDYQCVNRPTIANCATWDNLYCTSCAAQYYLKDQKCESCTSNCNYCNSQECFQCTSGYTLVKNGKSCVDCTKSENDADCGRCPLNQYFDTKLFTCAACKTNCIRCSTATNCFMCGGDYALEDPTNADSNCSTIANCQAGHVYGDHCELCLTGYFLNNGKCTACSVGCSRCIDEKTCIECSSSFKLLSGACVTSIDHCNRANNIQGCLECNEGYYLTTGSVCTQCSTQCSSCLNSTYCFRCSSTHYFGEKEGECIRMSSSCKVTDQYGCLECEYDKKLSDECEKDFATDKTINCTTQSYGYFLSVTKPEDGSALVYDKVCSKCNPHCKICEYNSTWCSACNDGYALKEDAEAKDAYNKLTGETATIYVCEVKPAECSRTEMGYCVECIDTYFLSGVKCIQCDKSCGSCTSPEFCQTCNSATDTEGHNIYWRPKSFSDKEGEAKGKCFLINETASEYGLDKCAHYPTTSGCSNCNAGYYIHENYCRKCPERCGECKEVGDPTETSDGIICTSCYNNTYISTETNATCLACSTIDKCVTCESTGCHVCEDSYSPSLDRLKCTKVNLALILPLSIAGGLILIAVILVFIFLLWRRRRRTEKERETEIRPFRVSSDLELALLSADNEKFPMKMSNWTLDFGLKSSKAIVDTAYTQKLDIMNSSSKTYYFEFLINPSHCYELEINPIRQTLKPGYAVSVEFKITMICTAVVSHEIGIVAMDVDDNEKETAKLKLVIESDLSTKLDHTELKPIMPPIGEGAFGLVFRGTYRGTEVAIKKMKARNLTDEQQKEFTHEVTMLSQLRHQTTVNLIGAVYTEGEIAIVTEFAEFGSLSKIWGKNPIGYDLKVKIMDDLAVALQFLHHNQIIHRDIKGENVLIYSLNPHSSVCGKLTDFGTCRNVSERALSTKPLSTGIGTPTYMSPESLQGTSDYSYPVDIYAYGMVLYETYTEKQGYENDERFNQPWMIPQFVIEGKRLERTEGMPDNYWNLLNKCWAQEAEKRPNMSEILETISSWGLDITHVGGEIALKKVDMDKAEGHVDDKEEKKETPMSEEPKKVEESKAQKLDLSSPESSSQ